MISFLAVDTPLRGELPKSSGLDAFLVCQREIVLTLSLGPAGKTSIGKSRQQPPRAGRPPPWPPSGRVGEARLGLGQFRNDHVQKVELQAPLLLSGGCGHGNDRSRLLLVKVQAAVLRRMVKI